MKLQDMKFKITDKKYNTVVIVGWDDIFGYEGEQCGVFARTRDRDICLTHNSGYGFKGLNDNIDIEVIDE